MAEQLNDEIKSSFSVRIEVPNSNGIYIATNIGCYDDILDTMKNCKLMKKEDAEKCVFTYVDGEKYKILIGNDEDVAYAYHQYFKVSKEKIKRLTINTTIGKNVKEIYFHKTSKNMKDIEHFINEMSPKCVSRIHGGISYPNIHVYVPKDLSGEKYKLHLTNWTTKEFAGANKDINVDRQRIMMLGFKPATGGPYAYWLQQL